MRILVKQRERNWHRDDGFLWK